MSIHLKYCLIVAGGSGSRMSSDTPKQFLLLKGKPILFHTIEKFFAMEASIQIVLVLPNNEISQWKKLVQDYKFDIPHTIVSGGNTRSQSVYNGLQAIGNGLVAIHDGVRPLISKTIIKKVFKTAELNGNAVVTVPLKDSIRIKKDGRTQNLDRNSLLAVQTPQVFDVQEIKAAYSNCDYDSMTDDASVYEANGGTIHIIEGDYSNIKITTPEDLIIAESLLGLQ